MNRKTIGLVLAFSLVLAACSSGTGGDTTTTTQAGETTTTAQQETTTTAQDTTTTEPLGDPIRIGVITTTSGALQTYGQQYLEGLEAGLAYATDGTNVVNNRPIEFVVRDDGLDPDAAVTHATELVGDGISIIVGTVGSGVALRLAAFAEENDILYISGPAATDAVTGINKNTFRSGRQSWQDVATAASLLGGESGSVLVFAQDTAFGQGNVAAVTAVLSDFTVTSLLVPESETEFTGYANQINQASPDLVFVAWAGATSGAMWSALNQQGVFDNTEVATGLGDSVTWPFYGDDPSGINFLNHYFPGAPDNAVNDFLVDNVAVPDLFTPDGFVAAQMIVQALSETGPDDVDGLIAALEGWTFDAPKGSQTIRVSDHAMIQPMFVVRLNAANGGFEAELLATLDGDVTAPPEQ